MTARAKRRAEPGAATALAAIVAAPAAALALSAAIVAFLPVGEPLAFAIGIHLMAPLWVTFACLLPLARSGWRAWVAAGAIILLAGFAVSLR